MHRTLKERKEANLKKLQERTQKIVLRREIKKVVKEQIIFERKKQLNEGIWDSIVDAGQIALSVVGAIPPLEAIGAAEVADAANAAIHFTRALAGGERIHFLYGLLSLVSVIPTAGDVVAKPIEWLTRLARLFSEESAIARNAGKIASFVGRNSETINNSVQRGQQFLISNRSRIERGLKEIQKRTREQEEATVNEADEKSSDNSDTESTGDSIVDSLINFVMSDETLRELFTNNSLVSGIMEAYDELLELFTTVRNSLSQLGNTTPEELAATAVEPQNESLKRLNESRNDRVSLKVLF